jgi:hypothetical protein
VKSIERTLLESVQRQKDKVVANVQEEMLETKLIEEHIIKQKDTFEFVEKHGSDKQAFLLAQTLKTELSDIEQKIATLTEKAKYSNAFFSETTNMIKAKLYMNVHCRGPSNDHTWAVWFQLSKWFQRRSILKHFSHRVQC